MRILIFIFLFFSFKGFAQNTEEVNDTAEEYTEEMIEDSVFEAETIKAVTFSPSEINKQNQTITEARLFDKQKYEKTIEGFDYAEKIKEKKKTKTNAKSDFKLPEKKSYLGIAQVILILIIAFVLILIIYLIIKQNAKNTRIDEEYKWNIIDLDKTEKPIEVIDQKIEEAIKAKNYSLAIRLYYLKSIAILYFNKWIYWKKDKTNATYCNELLETEYYSIFSNLTLHFEYSWFGKRNIDAIAFFEIEKEFKEFYRSIKAIESDNKNAI